MKKLILIALAFAGINASAANFGIKPVVNVPTCHGASTGHASLVLTGGTAPFTYLWSNGATTPALTNVPAGNYSVTVTDANGVISTSSFTMTQFTALNLRATIIGTSGQGMSDGCIHLNVDGGTPVYSYMWSNAATIESPCGLAAGTYTVTVTDAMGCTSLLTKTVGQQHAAQMHPNNNLSQVPGAFPSNAGNNAGGGQLKDLQIESGKDEASTTQTEEITLYPNPTTDFVTVRTGLSTTGELLMINTLGQTIHHQMLESNETRIDLSNVAKGNYVIVVKTEKGNTNKVISVVK